MSWLVPTSIPLPTGFKGFDPRHSRGLKDFQRYERHLPHWQLPGRCVFATFRLNDALPASVIEAFRAEKLDWEKRLAAATRSHGGQLPDEERAAYEHYQRAHLAKVEAIADAGHGECLLRQTDLRLLVEEALHYFEGKRCEMLSFVIMPNHVHALCRPLNEHAMEALAGSWKRHSADCIHRRLRRKGTLWQQESFTRIIRDAEHYRRAITYIANNPLKARLQADEATVWFHASIRQANAW